MICDTLRLDNGKARVLNLQSNEWQFQLLHFFGVVVLAQKTLYTFDEKLLDLSHVASV